MSIEFCNWNREGDLEFHKEDKESQLPERKRNLGITPSDDRHMGWIARGAEESPGFFQWLKTILGGDRQMDECWIL